MARSYNLISLPVDIETAFGFVSDFTNAAAWDPQAETVTKATDGPIGVGTRFDLVTANEADKWGTLGRLFAVQMHMTYEVLELERRG